MSILFFILITYYIGMIIAIVMAKHSYSPIMAGVMSWVYIILRIIVLIIDKVKTRKQHLKRISELLTLVKKSLFLHPTEGLCWHNHLIYNNHGLFAGISGEDYEILNRYLRKYGKPKKGTKKWKYWEKTAYYWEKGNPNPRHIWLNKHIKHPKYLK